MELVEMVDVQGNCYAVEYYDGKLYVGRLGGVDVISDNQSKSFIKMKGNFNGVRYYKQHFYLLDMFFKKWSVRVHDLNGESVRSWEHDDTADSMFLNSLAVSNDIVYIPSRSANAIKRYSLTGESAGEDIPVSAQLNPKSAISVGVTPDGHMLLSHSSPRQVVCLDLETGLELWNVTRQRGAPGAGGICFDNFNHLLVSTGGTSTRVSVAVLHQFSGGFFA